MYYLDIISAEKIIKKLQKHPLKKDIFSDIDALQYNPKLGKYLQSHDIYELKYPNLRIYYAVFEGLIIIADEEFEGIVTLLAKGNKNEQQRFLR
jgi:hypothetical protein